MSAKTGQADHQSSEGSYYLLIILMMAWLGGLILNAMPCVFPILSLKALAFLQKATQDINAVKKIGLAYALGVVLGFFILAIALVILKESGSAIGWGYQLQSPTFVTILIFILFGVGLNLSGLFEMKTVFNFGGRSALNKIRSEQINSFVTGLFATVVATPCTAPFMATAAGYALTQSAWCTVLIFSVMGFGFATPFLILSFFPKAYYYLPKSGPWMLIFREFLAFPIYFSCVWLLWVLAQQVDTHQLLWVWMSLIWMVFACWWSQHWGKVGGLKYACLTLIWILLILFPLARPFLKRHEYVVQAYSPVLLTKLLKDKEPVFVNVTAAWCITCQVNDTLVLSRRSVLDAFKRSGVTILKADWTNQDPNITAFLEKFNRQGVPLYVLYSKAGTTKILPQLLTRSVIFRALEGEVDKSKES